MAPPLPPPPAEPNGTPAPRTFFPSSGSAPVTGAHQDLRIDLYYTACRQLEKTAWIGSNQYVYYDGSDPSKWLAPDLFIRRGGPDDHFQSWKVWERGAPELAVEIVREEEATPADWARKLARYHALGVQELVRFEAEGASPLRVWDRVRDDLVERPLDRPRAESRVMGLALVVVGETLRLAEAAVLLLTPHELADAAEQRVQRLRAKLIAAGIDPGE